MGRTYSVPRSVKGESRILIIFSVKSLITTFVGAIIGIVPYFIFSILGLKIAAFVALGIFAILGFMAGTLRIPDSPAVGKLRKAGGEMIYDIIIRWITFNKRKKIYIYRKRGR